MTNHSGYDREEKLWQDPSKIPQSKPMHRLMHRPIYRVCLLEYFAGESGSNQPYSAIPSTSLKLGVSVQNVTPRAFKEILLIFIFSPTKETWLKIATTRRYVAE